MTPQAFYQTCLQQATDIVRQVQGDQLANETPDDEWTVRDLANHMLYEVIWVPDMLAGKTIAEVGDKYEGDLFEAVVPNAQTNLIAAWDAASEAAERAVDDCNIEDTAHLSYADTTVGSYLMQTGGDILVHAWDLAKSIGAPITFNEDVAELMWDRVKNRDMSGSGLFKPSLEYDDSDSAQNKILAHFGRNKDWTSTS